MAAAGLACGETAKTPAAPTAATSPTGAALDAPRCAPAPPNPELNLAGWDLASRTTLASAKARGVVVVRYAVQGCAASLSVLPSCTAPDTYTFSPYAATETKTARTASELYAEFPIGAASLSGKLDGARAIREDVVLVGVESLKTTAAIAPADLVGECAGATHVVRAIHVGGFGLTAGPQKDLEGAASAFGAPGPGTSAIERIRQEGDPDACADAQKKGAPSARCGAPLRIALTPLRADPACPPRSHLEGRVCVEDVSTPGADGGRGPARRGP